MAILALVQPVERVEPNDVPTFIQFWEIYPRRVCKKTAQKAWDKLDPDQKRSALTAIPSHVRQWKSKRTETQFIPHPATWINQERWDDEFEVPDSPSLRRDF